MTPIYIGEAGIGSMYRGTQSLTKLFLNNVTVSGVPTTTTTTTIPPCAISHNTSSGTGNTGTPRYYLEINLCSLPSGGTGYKIEIDSTNNVCSTCTGSSTGTLLYVQNPTNGTMYTISGLGSPSTVGTLTGNATGTWQAQYQSATNSMWLWSPGYLGATSVSVQITAINSSNVAVGAASNTLTGLSVDGL
tara:strand:+ start:101 stop:670 length:570 start_codon:yes stop_codon:yes gene_type:complete